MGEEEAYEEANRFMRSLAHDIRYILDKEAESRFLDYILSMGYVK